MWSIDGEEQFMSGNSVGTVTWNLNFSVQRDIWDGHSFHQILLFLIFTFHVVIVGRHVFWRKNTQWPLWIVQCLKYALFLISGTSIGTVHDIIYNALFTVWCFGLFFLCFFFFGLTVMMVLYALCILPCSCGRFHSQVLSLSSDSSHFWKDEFANFLDEIKELDVGPHVRSCALLLLLARRRQLP